MDNWHEELVLLKARLAVQHMALRAMARAHPHPGALLEEWRKLRADTVAAAYSMAADVRTREWLTTRVQSLAEDWTSELVDAVTRGAGQATPASDPGSLATA